MGALRLRAARSAQGEPVARFVAAGLLLLLSAPSWAEATRVTLVSTGDEVRARAFESSLRELLERLKLSLDVRKGSEAPEGEALAAVEADFTDADAVKLTVVDQLGRTVLVRRLVRAGNPQLQAEAAAHVVQSVMEELVALSKWKPPAVEPPPLEAPPLETAPPVATAEAPKPAAAAPPPHSSSRFGVDFSAFFGGRTFLRGAPITAGGGVSVAFALKAGNFRPTLTLLGDYHAPFIAGSEDRLVLVRIETLSLRALATLDVLGGDGWRVDVALGGGADLFLASASGSVPNSALRPPRTDADPVLSGMITGRLAVAPAVDVYLAFALDVDLWPVRYVARAMNAPPEPLYQPSVVRPMLVLGVSFNAIGPDPYWSSR